MRLRARRLTPDERAAFQNAILDAYDDKDSFESMLYLRLGKSLDRITTVSGLDNIVSRVIQDAENNEWTADLLQVLRALHPGNQLLWSFAQQFGLTSGTEPTGTLERKIRSQDSMWDVGVWRQRLFEAEGRVCRIEIASPRGPIYGTGFLFGPDAVMTNYHVVEEMINRQVPPTSVALRFDFKKTNDGAVINQGKVYTLATEAWPVVACSPYGKADTERDAGAEEPSTEELDYALLRTAGAPGNDQLTAVDSMQVAGTLPQRGWIRVNRASHELAPGALLFILQHPEAAPLKLAVPPGEIIGSNSKGTRLRYTTYTEPGSSGSPCFDVNWNLVAIHHLGDPRYPQFGQGGYNQGIPLSAILAHLEKHNALEVMGGGGILQSLHPVPATGEASGSQRGPGTHLESTLPPGPGRPTFNSLPEQRIAGSVHITPADLTALADLLQRSGRADHAARSALCEEIGVDPDSLSFIAASSAHDFGVQFVFHLDKTGNTAALAKLCEMLAPILWGQQAERLAQIRRRLEPSASLPASTDSTGFRVKDYVPKPGLQTGTRDAVAQIATSLELLVRFARARGVIGPISAFQAQVASLLTQITISSDYKDLHDALHELQFGCYNAMRETVARFPPQVVYPERLLPYRQEFHQHVDALQELVQRPTLVSQASRIGKLSQALADLDKALKDSARETLDEACTAVQEVLGRYPTKINERLVSTAEGLESGLELLNERLRDIRAIILSSLRDDETEQFDAGVAALESFASRLGQRVSDHSQWQDADDELRMIRGGLDRGMETLKLTWPKVRKLLDPLCENEQSSPWIGYRDLLDKALKGPNLDPGEVTSSFNDFCWWADRRFYKLDKELKGLFDQLRTIGEKLKSVAAVLESLAALPGGTEND